MTQLTSINMMIVSDNTLLEKRIHELSKKHDLNINITTCKSVLGYAVDIFIFDKCLITEDVLKNSRSSECILFTSHEALPLNQLDNPAWTAIWLEPLSDAMLEFYLKQALKSVELKRELRMSKTYLNTLIDSVPDLIWFKDLRGSHLKVNESFCKAVGKTKNQCEGRGHYYIWDLEPDEYAKGEYVCLETEEEVIRQNKTCLFDEKVKSKHGLRQFQTYKSPLVDEYGETFGTVGIAKDVTDLANIGRELRVILSSIPFAAMIVGTDDSIVSVNQKFCDYFNVTTEQVLHMNYPEMCNKILNTTPKQLENKFMTEIRYNSDGNQYVYHAQQQAIHDIFGGLFGTFFMCLDVTNEYELQHKLLKSANTDFLTNLYNRRYFYETISQSEDTRSLSFIYFDLDNFKKVNDTYGHQSGDNALILMADLLKESFAQHLIARLGGDEFVVAFFGSCQSEKVEESVKNFVEKTRLQFDKTPQMHELSVSAGIACNGSSKDVDTLLLHADKALYAAKAKGKACYCVYTDQ